MDRVRAVTGSYYREPDEDGLRTRRSYDTGHDGEASDTTSATTSAYIRGGDVGRLERTVRAGELVIDVKNFILWVDGEHVELRRREFELLAILASRPTQLVTRKELATEIWGNAETRSSRTIDVHIQRLRAKLATRSRHDYVRTVRGFGYRFVGRDSVLDAPQPRAGPKDSGERERSAGGYRACSAAD